MTTESSLLSQFNEKLSIYYRLKILKKRAVSKISSSCPAGFYAEPVGCTDSYIELGWRVGNLKGGLSLLEHRELGMGGTIICVSEP